MDEIDEVYDYPLSTEQKNDPFDHTPLSQQAQDFIAQHPALQVERPRVFEEPDGSFRVLHSETVFQTQAFNNHILSRSPDDHPERMMQTTESPSTENTTTPKESNVVHKQLD
jgi:hypothetical protein